MTTILDAWEVKNAWGVDTFVFTNEEDAKSKRKEIIKELIGDTDGLVADIIRDGLVPIDEVSEGVTIELTTVEEDAGNYWEDYHDVN